MKNYFVIFALFFSFLGVYLLFKQFNILGQTNVIQTTLNRNSELADPDLKIIHISARNCEFKPDRINLKMGDRVRIYVRSFDVMYGFAITAYGIDQTIEAEKEIQINFNADRAGEFTFFSSVYCTAENPKEVKGVMLVE